MARWLLRAATSLAFSTCVVAASARAAGAENLARSANLTAARSLSAGPYRIANVVDGKLTANEDIQACESCWAGDVTNLRDDPLDFIVDFGGPRVIDRIVVTTCRLKNQPRLTDFDVYGWAGSDWDGHQPLSVVRGSRKLQMECRFQPVETAKVCIRLLDNVRPTHNFPHISELEIFAAEGPAKRRLEPGGMPRPLSELSTASELETEAARLRALLPSKDQAAWAARRLELVEEKLAARREALRWIGELEKIDRQTEELLAAGVPEWAAAQREALAKYVLWIHWWIDHQQPDGQFGGSWNDDVELVCGWPVACLAASDRRTFDSLKLLAEGVWNWGPVAKHGYSRYTDVEHSAEEISYSQPRMVVLDYDDPEWARRCRVTVETCAREFLGENARGMLQFKSDWFGYRGDEPVVDAERPFDVPEGAKALKPGLYAAWRGDEEIRKIVLRYGDTWLDAAMQEYEGKPRGLLPERIDFQTGKPQGIALRMPPMRAAHYHLIGCYLLSDDRKYLVPAEETIRYFLVENNRADLPLMQSGDHEHMGLGDQLAVIASMWRILTGDEQFDPHFARWSRRLAGVMDDRYASYAYVDTSTPGLWVRKPLEVGAFRMARRACGAQLYVGWLATGDKELLVDGCYNLSCDLTDLWEPLTSWFYDPTERRVTSNDHLAHSIQTAATMLMLMYTGGYGPIEAKYPTMAVSWEGTTPEFAALVLETDQKHVKLLACNLEPEDRQVTMRLWELAPGTCRVTRGPDADGDDQMDEIAESLTVDVKRGTGVVLSLPTRSVQVVCVERQ
ncbi:MAG TPA: hypothetical protein VMY37_30375 [Thermoguttaceae bacterium]|nr:hypothetical protein [Thermoguttaceae bacterium]